MFDSNSKWILNIRKSLITLGILLKELLASLFFRLFSIPAFLIVLARLTILTRSSTVITNHLEQYVWVAQRGLISTVKNGLVSMLHRGTISNTSITPLFIHIFFRL